MTQTKSLQDANSLQNTVLDQVFVNPLESKDHLTIVVTTIFKITRKSYYRDYVQNMSIKSLIIGLSTIINRCCCKCLLHYQNWINKDFFAIFKSTKYVLLPPNNEGNISQDQNMSCEWILLADDTITLFLVQILQALFLELVQKNRHLLQ